MICRSRAFLLPVFILLLPVAGLPGVAASGNEPPASSSAAARAQDAPAPLSLPRNIEARAWYERGLALAKKKEYEQAVTAFTHVVDLEPGYIEAYFARALAYERSGKAAGSSAALTDLDRVLRDRPDHADALLTRAALLSRVKRADDAIADLSRYILLRPRDPLGYLNRATVFHLKKEYGKAISDYDAAIKLMEEEKARSRRPDLA